MNQKHFMQILSYVAIALIIASCGFKLRGSLDLPPQLQTLYVKSSNPYGDVTKEFTNRLQASGVTVVNTQQDALLTVDILNSSFSSHNTTIGGSEQSQQYTLNYTMNYQVIDPKNNIIYGPLQTNTTQYFSTNTGELLENSDQFDEVKQQMRETLVNQAMYRLSSQNALQAYQNAEGTTQDPAK